LIVSSVQYKGRLTTTKPRVMVGRAAYISLNDAALELIGYPKYLRIEFIEKYGARLIFIPIGNSGRGHLKVAYSAGGTTGRVYFQGVRDAFDLNLELGSSSLVEADGNLVWKLSKPKA
jgi:hypothetical protein